MRILGFGGNQLAAGGYEVANSLRFNNPSDDTLTRTQTAGDRQTYTFSVWIKRAKLGAYLNVMGTNSEGECLRIESDNAITYFFSGSSSGYLKTTQLFRDVSAWYHIVAAVDTTQATSSNRVKIYVNGQQITSFSSETYPSLNQENKINQNGETFHVGNGHAENASREFDGYMSEVVLVDGQQLDETSFGEFDEDTGIWKPIDVSGLTFGTNGFYLDFENSGSLGADVSGNGNNFTVNNLTSIDQSTDTCTNNFCTLNPLSADEMTFTNGNLDVDQASSSPRSDDNARGTMGVNVGKWYWEVKLTGATAPCVVGICFDELKMGSDLSGLTGVYAIQNASATYAYKRENGTTAETSGYPNPVANDIMNVAFDADNGKLYLGINGTYYNQAGSTGNPATGSNETFSSIDTSFFWLPWIESRGANQQALMNFGGGTSYSISSGNSDGNGYGNFEYSVPSGYYALNTKNLAEYG